MNIENKKFEIKKIIFQSNDSLALVKGIRTKANMNYSSEITISMSQLNQLLNQLKNRNEEFNIEENLTSEKMYNDEILFTINISQSYNRCLNLNDLTNQNSITQYRA